jgi:hypothetical protein
MKIEVSDPLLVADLRAFLQRNGCPSETWTNDTFEVRVLRALDEERTESLDRAKVFTHLREWCAVHPGVHTNLFS